MIRPLDTTIKESSFYMNKHKRLRCRFKAIKHVCPRLLVYRVMSGHRGNSTSALFYDAQENPKNVVLVEAF